MIVSCNCRSEVPSDCLAGLLHQHALADQPVERLRTRLGRVEHRRIDRRAVGLPHPRDLLALRVVEFALTDRLASHLGDALRVLVHPFVALHAEEDERRHDQDQQDELHQALMRADEIEHGSWSWEGSAPARAGRRRSGCEDGQATRGRMFAWRSPAGFRRSRIVAARAGSGNRPGRVLQAGPSIAIRAVPMRIRSPVAMPSHSEKPGGANTMIVDPCSNQPISSPFANVARPGISLGPR